MTQLRRPLATSLLLCLAPTVVIVAMGIGFALVTFVVEAIWAIPTGVPNAVVNGAVVPGIGVGVGIAAGAALGRRLTFPNAAAVLLGAVAPGALTLAVGEALGLMGSRSIPRFGIPVWAAGMALLTATIWARSRATTPPRWRLATAAAGLVVVDLAVAEQMDYTVRPE